MLKFTDEQEIILQSDADTLCVKAFAGCAKTSTQVEYAYRRPDKRFLYLAYNTAIKEEAAGKFPSNVKCVTGHGLAYPLFGRLYRNKLGNLKPIDLTRVFEWDFMTSAAILNIVRAFMCSADPEINDEHAEAAGVRPEKAATAIEAARKVWEAMIDTSRKDIVMEHDGYLKLYQLTSPKIMGYDVILCDEWQDANPTIVDIVRRQACGKFYVGDNNQAIYAWRGAVDALDSSKADAEYRLTTSFRFGAGVADIASRLLSDWSGETTPLRGAGKHETCWSVDRSAPHTVLARTNSGLFDAAVDALSSPLGFGFIGGVRGYKFDIILDGYHLYSDKRDQIRDRVIATMNDWTMLKGYAEECDDKEFKALIRVIEHYKAEIPSLVHRIKSGAKEDGSGGITLGTAHKGKGLEFDSVVLLDDFQSLEAKLDPATKKVILPDRQEINLIYVAMTRALRCLEVGDGVRSWLAESGHQDLLAKMASAVRPASSQQDLLASDEHLPSSSITQHVESKTMAPPLPSKDGCWVLGWVNGNPSKARVWLDKVSQSLAAGKTLEPTDRVLLVKLLGEIGR